MDGPAPRRWSQHLSASARRVSAGVAAGFLAGALVGGVGGRLAMFVLRLTSDPALHGVKTDDGFTIGRFTADTGFLVLFTAVAGVLGGLFYLVARGWMPPRARPWSMGLLGAVVGGAATIAPDGIDFQLLDPLPLAVAMFVALPGAYGVAVSVLAERFLRPDAVLQRSGAWLVGLVPLLAIGFLGPPGLLVVLGMIVLWGISYLAPPVAALWRSRPAVWIGRAALAAVGGVALAALVRDVGRVL